MQKTKKTKKKMLKICQMLKNALINSQKKWGDFVALKYE